MKGFTSMFRTNPLRIAGIVVLVAIAVFAVVRFAGGDGATAQAADTGRSSGTVAVTTSGTDSCDCCSVGASSVAPVEGVAQVDGAVQTISVDLSSGVYDPNVIRLKAGVPTEITFGQSFGCTAYVQSEDLGFLADLTRGPQTVKLPSLQPGSYGFACGMNMVTGLIVVE